MSRRLTVFAIVIVLLFVAVAVQAMNVQFFRASALDASPLNPRNSSTSSQFPRGQIVAADGTVLAESVPTAGFYRYRRVYPLGSLTSGVVGFAGPSYIWGLEAQYSNVLSPHAQPAQSLAQVLAPTSAADSLNLTLEPALQRIARSGLAGRDGAVVAINPQTGAVLAMYSNPNYNPTPLTSPNYQVAKAAWLAINTKDAHGLPPLGLVATQQTFPPGSTFKIVTTSAVLLGKPQLWFKKYPSVPFIHLPQSNVLLHNFGNVPCGGDVQEMLPPSCDPGYASLGLDLGGDVLATTANAFGFNTTPPLDLPGVVASYFPPAASFLTNLPGVAYSAIGQQNVRESALQNAMVAAAIANGGTIMTPHLMDYVTGPDGTVISRFKDSVWKQPLSGAQAARIVPLMQDVARFGTAAGWFLAADEVGAKTGTAQTSLTATNTSTDDWMIAFAPASHPAVAVAVVVPFQAVSGTGAAIAGPIMKCVIEGALALAAGLPATGTSTTCPA